MAGDYGFIARGVQAPNLLPVAQLLEQRRRSTERMSAYRDEQRYQRGRDAAADKERADIKTATATREQVGLAMYVSSKAPDYKRAKELFPKVGLDPAMLDELPEAEARGLLTQLGEKFSGIKADDPNLGQLYKMADGRYGTASDARGKEFFDEDPAVRDSWGSPWKGVDPKTGKRGLYQTNSRTGVNRPAQVGPDGQLQPDSGDEGSTSVSSDNAIYRQAVGYFGGEIDPISGQIQILTTDAPKAQALARRATELYATGLSIAAAVDQAAAEKPWEGRRAAPAPSAPAPTAPRQAAPTQPQAYREGQRAQRKNADGTVTVIEYRGGRWGPVSGG